MPDRLFLVLLDVGERRALVPPGGRELALAPGEPVANGALLRRARRDRAGRLGDLRRVFRVALRVSCICSFAVSTSAATFGSWRPIVRRNSSWSSMSEKFPDWSTTASDEVRSEV